MIRKKNHEIIGDLVPLMGRIVLDVGCGDGGLARAMAAQGAHVTGIETSPRQLEKAQATPRVRDEHFLSGRAQELPVGDGTVDLVVFANSLHHVPVADQPLALKEAARALKAGGLLFVSEPLAEGDFFLVTRLIDDETEVRAKAYGALRESEQWGLLEERELTFINPARYADFESFRDRMAAIDAERARIVTDRDATLRAAFRAHGRQQPDGWHFDQPTRINIFRKARR